VACNSSPQTPAVPTVEPTLDAPAPDETVQAFLTDWEQADYLSMFNLLTVGAQSGLTPDTFANRYVAAQSTAGVKFIRAQLRAVLRDNTTTHANFHVEWDTVLFGTLSTDNELTLTLEDGAWRVAWNDGVIWPGLENGGAFQVQYEVPRRANIYDSEGKGLAVEGKLVTVGIVPGNIENEAALLAGLSPIVQLSPEDIQAKYAGARADWYVPIADISFEASQANNDFLKTPGIERRERSSRIYSGLAPLTIGVIGQITQDNLAEWKDRGYRGDEWVGTNGLEAWGEPYLAGTHGGKLTLIDGQGQIASITADQPAVPSRSIYTSIDRILQESVDNILAGHTGAIVVLDPNNGAVLAMSSYPSFNPNAIISPETASQPAETSYFNRATQGAYPPGSTFKPITMAAGMEVAGLNRNSPFFDPGYWDGFGEAFRKLNWKPGGDGAIDLVTGLSASNNTVFYEVGKRVQDVDQFALPNMARAFGLGATTGITGVIEVPGVIPDPDWKLKEIGEVWVPGDGVNMAIGQGYVQATPLQMAVAYAAIANGGTVYRPRLIQKIGSSNEPPEEDFPAEVMGQLPVKPETIQAIQDGLRGVITSPKGTAGFVFKGFPETVAGKTGTAETGGAGVTSHAWFICYAPAENPKIVVAVFLENGGQGSYNAAPLARNVLETYFGLPLTPPPAAPPPGPIDR
jgi:penicillin-binding protein 2